MGSWPPPVDDEFIGSQESEYDGYSPPSKRICYNAVNGNTNQNNCAWSHDTDWLQWDKDEVAERLNQAGLMDVAAVFKKECIVGEILPRIKDKHLDEMGIRPLGNKLRVQKFIEDVTRQTLQKDLRNKVFNDPIHGHIELHPLCVKIIDTPEFQRLRFLKQLGTCYFVYPGASHNRFEHSLGVCHLAGRLVRALQNRQPELKITDTDILCVEIAGLCHDLGHGPFSHLFDGKFIPAVLPNSEWKHEEASTNMFNYLVRENSLEPEFDKYGLTEQDRVFIKEQIAGPSKPDQENWTLEGRPKDKSFLYEVVANKRNGIDVDKWDYFARDCHMLGIRNNFDHDRCIHFSRVLLVEGKLQICYRYKEVGNLYDMFHTRQTLHRRAYQHKTTNIIEKMVTEALVKANDHIKFTGEDGKKLKMSESIHDMKAFSQMTDHVFNLILNSTEADLRESREILKKVLRRELYKCVGQTQTKDKILKEGDKPQMVREVIEKMDKDELECSPLTEDSIDIQLVNLDYGMKEKNPIDSVRFYSKDRPDVAVQIRKEQESSFIPGHFKEQQIRIYSKQVDPRSLEMVRKAFNSWCNDKNFPAPKGGDENSLELTPVEKGKASNSSNDTEGSDGHHRGESAKVKIDF
ncbi:deoxynucleoside triphosphate triphosphohydrolase SAMHD1-like isoform X3 [Mya arenaria]|nr:deoxynucleoside triphosphate triphosphohydrolase SAMHD1-like isoform X3 [Mya arenaria]XP_052817335.1 deoxynucleoside triphosphate triphosphohydrolase SAMHD1-like isoform X3 [Mya arenaria]XP_052817336.1 deoxynucleoside triphosphate triphosphohydrolase SAMHD1-like isoform X3 [Mya arenaria]XP_052817337.1 deoxynucleoside triphosphate triphosphohydrolase SAMHD1-like isoform X3 [Mya arenaria]XP_052817338.1 deoxynucleoside triphosphate triphosphohydrolase SAMHD1-like isoform X3 [Mya arenaria]